MTGPQLTGEAERVLLAAVAAAPSLHNTQPWRFEVGTDRLRILADPRRQLAVADPYARQLHISCGAAVFNARLALEHLGLEPKVRLLPEPDRPRVLADVLVAGVRPGRSTTRQEDLYAAIPRRHTNREPFRDEPVPAGVLAALSAAAQSERAQLVVLTGPQERHRLLGLLREATEAEGRDPRVVAECRPWIGGALERPEGVPADVLGPRPTDPRAAFRDLGQGLDVTSRGSAEFEARPTLAVLTTERDDPEAWLRAGQALQRVWLLITVEGLAASFVNQPLERPELRWLVRRLREGGGHPQMLMRVGRGPAVPGTGRRPVEELRARPGFAR
jgi:Nitroreductase family